MDVTNDSHRGAHGLHVALFDQDLARHVAELLHVRFGQRFAVHQVLHPLVALCDHVTKPPRVGADGVAFVAFAATSPTAGVSSCDAGARLFSRFSTTLDMFLSAPVCVCVFCAGNSSSVPVPLSSPKPLGVEPGSSVFRRWSAKKQKVQSRACCSSAVPFVATRQARRRTMTKKPLFFLPSLFSSFLFIFFLL